jgi:hypothetical protein
VKAAEFLEALSQSDVTGRCMELCVTSDENHFEGDDT